MLSAAWARIQRWIGLATGEQDGEDADSDPTAFSLLDASVNYSHGQSDGEAVRELQEANERASELEDAQRRQR